MAGEADEKPKVIIIKKKGGGHGHHGGAWKVAYADFVTAMMALFIVLWLLSVADPKTKKDIARYFRDPGFLQGGTAMIVPGDDGGQSGKPAVMQTLAADGERNAHGHPDDEQANLKHAEKALQEELDKAARENPDMANLRKQVQVSVTPEGLTIQLIDKEGDKDLLFDLSSAELKPELISLLKRMAPTLANLKNPLVIGGHTDARVFARGAHKTNWDLSYERANNARRILETGELVGHIHRVTAYGSSEPYVPSDPNAAENRRLSIVALRMTKARPSVFDGGDGAGGDKKAAPTVGEADAKGGAGGKGDEPKAEGGKAGEAKADARAAEGGKAGEAKADDAKAEGGKAGEAKADARAEGAKDDAKGKAGDGEAKAKAGASEEAKGKAGGGEAEAKSSKGRRPSRHERHHHGL